MPEEKPIKKLEKKEFDEVEAFVGEAPTVTIKGRKYKVRRLGVSDVFKLGRILAVGAAGMGKEIGKLEMNPGVLAGLLIVSFPYAEDQCLEFIASIIGMETYIIPR
ncbi:hypothetical protein ES708_29193 [subsurface metagenome]